MLQSLNREEEEDIDYEDIVLETPFNEAGHVEASHTAVALVGEDGTDAIAQEQQTSTGDAMLPLAVFKQTKTIKVPKASLRGDDGSDVLNGKRQYEFPSTRLLRGFEQALLRKLDPTYTGTNLSDPDLVSILTGALVLKCRGLITDCVIAIDDDDWKPNSEEVSRALKLAAKFSKETDFEDALILSILRRRHPKEIDLLTTERLNASMSRLNHKYSALFDSTSLRVPETPLGYPHLADYYVERSITGEKKDDRLFKLVREWDGKCFMSARLNQAKNAFLLFMGDTPSSSMREFAHSHFSSMESNLLGDTWTLLQLGIGDGREERGKVVYTHNPLGRVPNSMTIFLELNLSAFQTKKPRWSERLGWSLDFRRRVKVASKKNFLLLDSEDKEKIVMLFGKRTKHTFSLDICHPMNPAIAFAVALTTFADKLLVT